MKKKISKAVMMRLPRYYRYLSEMDTTERETVSSHQLSVAMGFTASQIRQDLNNFGDFGVQGLGYNIEYLREQIAKALGMDRTNNMVLVGYGNVGNAIINYPGFANKGFRFKAIFDIDFSKIGKDIYGIPIYHVEKLNDYVERNNINIIVLTVPKTVVKDVVKNLKIKRKIGIWNFASIDLKLKDNYVVENVHLSDSLMRLSYRLWGKNGK